MSRAVSVPREGRKPPAQFVFSTSKATPHNGARRFGERFCPKRKYGKCGNTGCIFHFSYCTIGSKDPTKPAAPIVRCCLSQIDSTNLAREIVDVLKENTVDGLQRHKFPGFQSIQNSGFKELYSFLFADTLLCFRKGRGRGDS